jgi:hypothetical protein
MSLNVSKSTPLATSTGSRKKKLSIPILKELLQRCHHQRSGSTVVCLHSADFFRCIVNNAHAVLILFDSTFITAVTLQVGSSESVVTGASVVNLLDLEFLNTIACNVNNIAHCGRSNASQQERRLAVRCM